MTGGGGWKLLQGYEGGSVDFRDDGALFWLRSDFGTMRDFDPSLSEEECRSQWQFASHGERRRFAFDQGVCCLGADIAVYCVDVGAAHRGCFGFWRRCSSEVTTGIDLDPLVALLVDDIQEGRRVTLGLESPLMLPVPDDAINLGRARAGDGNRAWSAAAGVTVLALGLQQLAWVFKKVATALDSRPVPTFRWPELAQGQASLHLWEAFVTGSGRGDGPGVHVEDARTAGEELIWRAVQLGLNGDFESDVVAQSPLNLAAVALLWSGLSTNVGLLREPITVIAARR